MSNPIDLIRRRVRELDADAVVLSSLPDIRWSCGFTGSNGLLVITPDDALFLSDGRYAEQARHEVQGVRVETPGYDLIGRVAEVEMLKGSTRVLFQSDDLTVARLSEFEHRLPYVQWGGISAFLDTFTAAKGASEIEAIRKAQHITECVYRDLLELIVPGVTERELSAEITYRHLRHGAEKLSFDTIVAAGPNGALPHAHPGDRPFVVGDLIVIDMGCFVDGYASDMTRTVALGEPGDDARHVYDVVLRAQEAALNAARADMSGRQLDGVARSLITDAGFGDYFNHSLGHGVGLRIHEWPRVSATAEDSLPADAVVTIEPGIYLPGRFGVRIEDMIWLKEGGCENLTTADKSLLVL